MWFVVLISVRPTNIISKRDGTDKSQVAKTLNLPSFQTLLPPRSILLLLKLRGLVRIKHVHHIAKLLNGLQRRIVRIVPVRLIVDNEAAGTLVQHTDDHLIQDHLRQLPFHLLGVQTDHLGNVVNLHAAEGLDDLDQVLLQHGIVQASQVVADEGVAAELVPVGGQGALVLLERSVAVGAGDGLHGLERLAGVLDGLLRGQELVDVVGQVEHDLAEQHVLQRGLGPLRLVLRVVAVQSLDEVAEGRLEVLVLGVQHARLHVEVGLEQRRGVDRGGARARAGEGGAGLGDVAEGVVYPRLEQLDFDEDELVIHALELTQETVDERQGVIVGLLGHVQGDEAGFEVLAEEGAAL